MGPHANIITLPLATCLSFISIRVTLVGHFSYFKQLHLISVWKYFTHSSFEKKRKAQPHSKTFLPLLFNLSREKHSKESVNITSKKTITIRLITEKSGLGMQVLIYIQVAHGLSDAAAEQIVNSKRTRRSRARSVMNWIHIPIIYIDNHPVT